MRDRTKKIFSNLAAQVGDRSDYSNGELTDPFEDSGSDYFPSEEGSDIIIFVKNWVNVFL